MKIKTRQFGTFDVDESKIITMPVGMPGFSDSRRFILFEREETRPFYWYQSVDDPDLSLAIMDPYLFKSDYRVNIKPVLKEMQWDDCRDEDIKIYVIINASNGEPEDITANLMGPLVINVQKHEAIQLMIQNSSFSHDYPIFGDRER